MNSMSKSKAAFLLFTLVKVLLFLSPALEPDYSMTSEWSATSSLAPTA